MAEDVWVIESDTNLRRTVLSALIQEGYAPLGIETPEEAIALFESGEKPRIVICGDEFPHPAMGAEDFYAAAGRYLLGTMKYRLQDFVEGGFSNRHLNVQKLREELISDLQQQEQRSRRPDD